MHVLYYIIHCDSCDKNYAVYASNNSVAFYFDADYPHADTLATVQPAAIACPHRHQNSGLQVLSKAAVPITDGSMRTRWLYLDKKPVRV